MKTDDLIKNLSVKLPGSHKPGFTRGLMFIWMAATIAMLAISFYLMPIRPDFADRSQAPFFRAETAVFLFTFLAAAVVAYRSSIPGLLSKRDQLIGLIFLIATTALVVSRLSFTALHAEWLGEMSFYRGRCGPILFMLGAIEGALTLALARRLAPTRPAYTALWLGLSAGTMGLFFMQFICDHENFLHLAIWHLTPVILLAGVSAIVGKKFLRW